MPVVVHELFEEQVERTPEAVAVVFGDFHVTYRELNSRANQLARCLRDRGICVNRLVGVCMGRCPDMIVSLLSILKAGAAYVPLDPQYPAERLRYMVQDANPQIVLAQGDLKGLLPIDPSRIVVPEMRTLWGAGYREDNLPHSEADASPDTPVYVIYTSGSTGRPKGTAMPHRSVVNLIEWHRQRLGVGAHVKVLQFAALSFDVAFQEIFSTLCMRGTLLLVEESVRRDLRSLTEILRNQAVDRLFLPPVILQRLAEYCASSGVSLEMVRDVIAAGEPLRIGSEVRSLFRQMRGSRLHNHYGPTETHVVTSLTLDGDPENWPTLPPIGTPISNVQIHILDEQRRPVSVAVHGEIYIGGVSVALGYLGNPALTAERFIADPFSLVPGSRLYKTGDLGCLREDGMLECLGRNDFQVKIRGFRVELGEIESMMLGYPNVRQAVVTTRRDRRDEISLVGYVVWRDNSERKTLDPKVGRADAQHLSGLREFLQARLPSHMVPPAFVELSDLPLTPNGKIDQKRLPPPKSERTLARPYVAASTTMESVVGKVWAEVLGITDIGVDDEFFELGGDSLKGMELVTHVAETVKVDRLSIVTLFEYPTVREMSQHIETVLSSESYTL